MRKPVVILLSVGAGPVFAHGADHMHPHGAEHLMGIAAALAVIAVAGGTAWLLNR